MKYLYIDGDNIGLKIEQSFLNNDAEELRIVNLAVINAIEKITSYLTSNDQEIIFSGADGIIVRGNNLDIKALLKKIRSTDKNFTFSVGIGNSLSDAYIALRYAKSYSKNVAVNVENGQFNII